MSEVEIRLYFANLVALSKRKSSKLIKLLIAPVLTHLSRFSDAAVNVAIFFAARENSENYECEMSPIVVYYGQVNSSHTG